jgi:hypothetical protein
MWPLFLVGRDASLEEFAHLGIEKESCLIATQILTLTPLVYLFMWHLHFFLVAKGYYERG